MTQGAIGTATYVCNGEALSFGHPFLFSGPTLLGANRASILAIVKDPLTGSFKLGEVGDWWGRSLATGLPASAPSWAARSPRSPSPRPPARWTPARPWTAPRRSCSRGRSAPTSSPSPCSSTPSPTSTRPSTSSAAAARSCPGRCTSSTRSGRAFALSRSNRWTSGSDITLASVDELPSALLRLVAQEEEPIKFTGVDIDVEVERTVREFRIQSDLWSRAPAVTSSRPSRWWSARIAGSSPWFGCWPAIPATSGR